MKKQKYPLIVTIYFIYIKGIWSIWEISHRVIDSLWYLLRTCVSGFLLGILKKETIHLIDDRYFQNVKKYSNEAYNLSGLVGWEERVINKYFHNCKSLLITSVGGGREVLALRKRGYKVEGFECNQFLVNYANVLLEKKLFVPNIQYVPRDKVPKSNKIFDGIIVGWGSYMLIQGRKQRVLFLLKLRDQIHQQAPILLSFFNRSDNSKALNIIKVIADRIRIFLRREPVEFGDTLNPTYCHRFTREEIESELREAGFRLELYSQDEYVHAVGFAV